APVHGIAGAVLDSVGGRYAFCGGASICLRSRVRTDKPRIYPVRMARTVSSTNRGDFTQEPTIRKGAISSHIGNVCSCGACVIAISLPGLWVGLLRFAFLPAARATVDCPMDGCTDSTGDAPIMRSSGTTTVHEARIRQHERGGAVTAMFERLIHPQWAAVP